MKNDGRSFFIVFLKKKYEYLKSFALKISNAENHDTRSDHCIVYCVSLKKCLILFHEMDFFFKRIWIMQIINISELIKSQKV